MNTFRKWSRIIANQEHPLRFLISRLLMRTGLSRFLLIRREGYTLRFYPSSLTAKIWVDPASRQRTERFFRDYLRQGDTVIDIGANIGTMALEAGTRVGDNGRVFTFEPHPTTFKYLEGNLRLNGITNTHAHNFALGNTNGQAIYSSRSDDSQNSVVEGSDGVQVPIHRLDDLGIGEREIALIKIDVEGYEKFVLEGSKNTLSITKCVYFESADEHFERFGYTSPEVFELLSKHGFDVFEVTPVNTISKIAADHTSRKKEDLVAIRQMDDFLERTGFQLSGEEAGS